MAKLKGLKKVVRNINHAVNEIKEDISDELYEIGLDIGMLAQNKAPIESGDLRDSLQVAKDGANRVLVSFGGDLTTIDGYDYAIRQHEDMSLRHSGPEHGKVDGGEAKFLEKATREIEPNALKRLEKRAGRSL